LGSIAACKPAAQRLAEALPRMTAAKPRLNHCILEIKLAPGLKKPVQLPIKRGSEGLLPSVNTL